MDKESLYIVADAQDNSITLSEGLVNELRNKKGGFPPILMFKLKDEPIFGFKEIGNKMASWAECGVISYNEKLDSWGFTSKNPTVNMIYYIMGIESEGEVQFAVSKQQCKDAEFYQISRR